MYTFDNMDKPRNPEARFSVRYRIAAGGMESAERIAREITIEQTIEAPIECATESILEQGIIGRVEKIETNCAEAGVYDADISYRCDITGYSVPQLLNVIYGNSSLKRDIRVIGLDFPRELLAMFGGPTHGIDGIRSMLGVFGRPLACTPLKPMGLSVRELSDLAAAFTRGGVDFIKDDHGLSNQPFHPFYERVSRCQEAISRENARGGRTTLYCPMLSGGFDELEKQARHCVQTGAAGMLIAPMLVGFDAMRYLAKAYKSVIIGHPSLCGGFFSSPTHGMTPALLLGTLFRLIGTDISVFPNAGGRFTFTKKECADVADALKRPLAGIKAAYPCPAGGMDLDKIGEMARNFGADATLLIGGSLLKASKDIAGNTAIFMDRIRQAFPGCTG